MKTQDLSQLSRLERLLFNIRDKHAQRVAVRRKINRELYKTKYGKVKPEKKPWTWFKWACFSVILLSVIVLFYSMVTTLILMDSQMMVAIIGAFATIITTLLAYAGKSSAENREGGITYQAMQNEFAVQNPELLTGNEKG